MLERIICAIKGHDYSPKVVQEGRYCRATLDTCDRCGAGECDLKSARRAAMRFQPYPSPPASEPTGSAQPPATDEAGAAMGDL